MRIEERLGEIALDVAKLTEVEPHIYTFTPDNEAAYYTFVYHGRSLDYFQGIASGDVRAKA